MIVSATNEQDKKSAPKEREVAMTGKHDSNGPANPDAVSQQIDENLKRLYTEEASEELPQSLLELIESLRKQETQTRAGDG